MMPALSKSNDPPLQELRIGLNRIRAARLIAITADLLQMGVFPLFAEGVASPLEIALDVVVCGLLTRLVGWHFAFLPSFIAELVPLVDLVPTWTIAILIATRQKPVSPPPITITVNDPARRDSSSSLRLLAGVPSESDRSI